MLHRSKFIALLMLVCAWPALAWGQQEMRSSTKGSSTPLPITGSAIDADHNALDVKCLAGCTGGGGAGDASLAEQQAQTAILTTIDADTGTIASAIKTEDDAHVDADKGIMMLGVRNSSLSVMTSANGDYSPFALSGLGELYVTTATVTPGTSATNLGKAEDAAHSTGDTGVMALCVRRDTAATSATTDGDYNPCQTDASGALWTTNAGIGATTDAACTAGSTGSLACKLRLMTSQLDAIQTSIQTLDDAIESTRLRATLYDSGGNEIVVPTAGLTHYAAAAASTNATSVEASSGTVYHYSLTNTTSTIYYLRMYNLATAPTCSSATGFVESIPIPASTSGGGRERPMNIGQAFTTGIAYCITGGSSSTDNTNAAAGVFVSILYKP